MGLKLLVGVAVGKAAVVARSLLLSIGICHRNSSCATAACNSIVEADHVIDSAARSSCGLSSVMMMMMMMMMQRCRRGGWLRLSEGQGHR